MAVPATLSLALRALRRQPGFAAAVVATLALAIGATTTIFSLVDGTLLRPLPFREPERLVALDVRAPTGFLISLSIPNYRDWRDRSRVFDGFAAAAGWGFVVSGDGPAEVVDARAVIGDFFALLGLEPARGRTFSAAESVDHEGADRVAVVSDAFWQRRFGGAGDVVGRSLVLDGEPFTVVGVLPAGRGYPSGSTEVYVPMGAIPDLPWDDRDSSFGTRAFGRLRPGVDLGAAQRDLDRVVREVRDAVGEEVAGPELRSLTSLLVGEARTPLWILLAAVGLLLLIAVANVGNLLLARGEDRRAELALRAALGASPGTLVKSTLVEALVLSGLGGFAGAGLAAVAVRALVPRLPSQIPEAVRAGLGVDGGVLAFGAATSLVAGLLFGVVPALRAARVDLVSTFRVGARTTGREGAAMRSALVVAEVALALVLLVGGGLLLRSLERLSRVDKGFDSGGVLVGAVGASPARVADKASWQAYYAEILDGAAALPGVDSAALTLLLPLGQRSWELRLHPEGVPVERETGHSVLYNVVSNAYFDTLGVTILRGRGFAASDRDGAPPVAVVDETLAARFWPAEDPLGKRVTFEDDEGGRPLYRTIVGVAKNVRHYELASPSRIQVYVPFEQTERRWGMSLRLALATSGDPESLIAPLRALVTAHDASAPLYAVGTLDANVDGELARSRGLSAVVTAFAAAALALAALGVFSVMSYAVSRRRRTIGIRLALGATRRDVVAWVAGQALRLVLAGFALGAAASLWAVRALASLLFEVSPYDPWVYAAVAAVLVLAALLAALLPARRAAAVDPAIVLAAEG